MQLVAYGAQDIYLTGNPQITFFKVVYRRHTNFSMEAIEQTVNGSQSSGGSGTVTISRNGDLVHKVYLTTSTAGVTRGSNLFSEVELEIGGQRIDRHYTDWCNAWNELSTNLTKSAALKSMQGDINGGSGASTVGALGDNINLVQVPLQFWFCRNIGLALPLIALQYHEVKLKIVWGGGSVGGGTGADLNDCGVICDYIYLDTDERRRFAQVSHEYLIEQVQRQIVSENLGTNGLKTERLNFNHPVKELIWTYPGRDAAEGSSYDGMIVDDVQLKLNGHDRFSVQKEPYFTLRQPFEYHTAVPFTNYPSEARRIVGTVTETPTISSTASDTVSLHIADGLTVFNNVGTADVAGGSFAAGSISFSGTTLLLNGAANTSTGVLAPVSGVTTIGTAPPAGTTVQLILTVSQVGTDDVLDAANQPITLAVGDTFVIDNPTITQGTGATAGFLSVTVAAGGLPDVTANSDKTIATIQAAGGSPGVDATEFTLSVRTTVTSQAIETSGTGNLNSAVAVQNEGRTSKMTKKIGVYSFALKPEEHQPSGSCNFSRIDNAELRFNKSGSATTDMTIYAVNYNVLRIMSGMGGLAYSN